MDVLTHLFLPIAVAYAIRPDLFPAPRYLALAVFAVLPDLDKALGTPGMLHSLLGVCIVGVGAVLVERGVRNSTLYATLAVGLFASHLLLDFLDGGPVTLLYPVIKTGVGLDYPTNIVFGSSVTDVAVQDPLPRVQAGAANPEREVYPLLNGYGFLSALVFVIVYVGAESRAGSRGEQQ
jgi:membrane-bound metal-dependent hydrolase YbcI (DUF457 family)